MIKIPTLMAIIIGALLALFGAFFAYQTIKPFKPRSNKFKTFDQCVKEAEFLTFAATNTWKNVEKKSKILFEKQNTMLRSLYHSYSKERRESVTERFNEYGKQMEKQQVDQRDTKKIIKDIKEIVDQIIQKNPEYAGKEKVFEQLLEADNAAGNLEDSMSDKVNVSDESFRDVVGGKEVIPMVADFLFHYEKALLDLEASLKSINES